MTSDKNRPDATDTFHTMPVRLIGERTERAEFSGKALNYHHPFLDDCLRAILPHDLVLLVAPSGLGKTELALAIAMENAKKEYRVGYFALEAEPRELERRTKFAWLSAEVYRRNHARKHELNYVDWLLHRCEDLIGPELDEQADRAMHALFGSLWTYYRGEKFTQQTIREQIEKWHHQFDLIVVDHLHYVDADDDANENRAMQETVKTIRDVSLRIGKPVLVVAHLRKREQRLKQLMPHLEDVLGSKHITNICTQVITLERATGIEASKWWLSPTFMSVLKDRRAGAPPFVALTHFDRRTRRYEANYTLGRVIKSGTEWDPLKPGDAPSWATCHRQLELELSQ